MKNYSRPARPRVPARFHLPFIGPFEARVPSDKHKFQIAFSFWLFYKIQTLLTPQWANLLLVHSGTFDTCWNIYTAAGRPLDIRVFCQEVHNVSNLSLHYTAKRLICRS